MLPHTSIFLLLLTASTGEGVKKRWIKNWDLDSPSNWQHRRLPCSGKAAILPRYPSNSMFLGGDLTVGSMDLPVEGEVILGAGTHLVLDDNTRENCQDAEWSHQGEDEWWDPDAWVYPGYEDTAYSVPVPDLHRPPCTRDAAVFPGPADSLYTLTLAPPAIFVITLSVGDKNYTTSEFAAYTRTTEGRSRFRGASSRTDGAPLYVESPGQCGDMTGCLCGTESAAAIICRIKSARCVVPRCDKPIDMTGFCCPECGAEVTISHNRTLPLASVEALLTTHQGSQVMRGVKAHLAKMKDQKYHVYFTAVAEDGDYSAASQAFIVKFDQELNAGRKHEALVATSSNLIPLPSKSVASHYVAAILVTLFVCLIIIAVFFYMKKRKVRTNLFRRLEASSRRVSVVSDVVGGRRPSNASGVFAYSRESGLRFFNPIFNQSMASLAGAGLSSVSNENVPTPITGQEEGQHENPVYAAYQSMSPEEQQASEEAQRTRERILEAAGQMVASIEGLQVHYKERKSSTPSGNDLEVITEEKEAKQVDNRLEDVLVDITDVTDMSIEDPTADINSERDENFRTAFPHEVSSEILAEGITESTITDDNIIESQATAEKEEKSENASKISSNIEISTQEEQMGADNSTPFFPSIHEVEELASSSSTDDDDDDTSNALTNLEGFSPLVGMKFKK